MAALVFIDFSQIFCQSYKISGECKGLHLRLIRYYILFPVWCNLNNIWDFRQNRLK